MSIFAGALDVGDQGDGADDQTENAKLDGLIAHEGVLLLLIILCKALIKLHLIRCFAH